MAQTGVPNGQKNPGLRPLVRLSIPRAPTPADLLNTRNKGYEKRVRDNFYDTGGQFVDVIAGEIKSDESHRWLRWCIAYRGPHVGSVLWLRMKWEAKNAPRKDVNWFCARFGFKILCLEMSGGAGNEQYVILGEHQTVKRRYAD